MADNETFTFESAKEFFKKEQYADELEKMSNNDLMALNKALYDGNKVGEGELTTMRDLANVEEHDRLKKYAKADLSSYKEEELEDILALAEKHDAEQGNYVDFAKEIINKINAQKKSLEDQQQKLQDNQNNNEEAVQPSQDGDQGGDQGEGSETDGNEDAVKKAEQALDDYLKEEYKKYLDVNYTDVESVSANDTLNYEQWKEKNIDDYKNNEEYKKLVAELEAARGTKPQQQNKSTNGNEDAVKQAEQALDDYVFEKYKWSKYIQYNDYEEMPTIVKEGDYEAFYNDFAKNNPEDKEYKKLAEALEEAKGTKTQQQNKDTNGNEDAVKKAEQALEDYLKEEYKKYLDVNYTDVESVSANDTLNYEQWKEKNIDDYKNNEEYKKLVAELEAAKQKENSVDSNESENSSQQSQSDSNEGGDQGGDQGDSDQGGDQGDSDQGEGSEADKTEQKDHSQNSGQGIKITKDNALDVLNKQFHRLRPEEIIELRKIIKEEHNDQLNNLDNKIIDKTQTFLAGETVILQTSQLYHLDNLLDSVREDNKDDGKGSTNQIGLSAANLKNEVGQRIKDFEELYGLDEQSRVDDEQIAKNVELLKNLPSFEKATYKESDAIAAENVSYVARQSTKFPPQMEDIVGALKSDGLAKVDKERLLDHAVAKIKDVKKADLIKNEDIADFQYLLAAVKESRPKVKVGKQEKLLFNAKKEYEKNNENKELSDDLKDAYDVLDRITVIGGADPYGKRKVKGQEAEDIKNTFKEQCRLETEMFFANTNKGEKIDPKEFEKEYALRLQTGLLKLVNYEEASKLTAMKEGGEKDIAKAFEDAFDSKKKIKISTVAFSAYHATEQDAINTACQKSPKALSAYASSKNDSIKEQNKSQLKRVFSLGKGLLESAGWGAAFGFASKVPPLGVAIVAGLSFARQTQKLIKDFKQKREEEKQQGREYKFKDFVKEKDNRWRMAGYALSAASTGLAIAAAAIPGANAALLMTARSTTMMMSLGIGVKTTFDSMKKAKTWKEKLLIGGTFLASIAVARFAGKSVQEVMANRFPDTFGLDAITGADQSTPQEQVAENNPNLQARQEMIDHGKGPNFGAVDLDNDNVLDSVDQDHGQGWATANETQIDRAFDADPKGINEALKELNPEHKWMNSDQLHEMMEKGQFDDAQLKAIHAHASSHFDQQGHITDSALEEFYEERAPEQARREETVEIEKLEPRRPDSIPVDESVDLNMDGKPDTLVKIVDGKPVVSYLSENTGEVEVIKEGSTVRVDIDGNGKIDSFEVFAKEGYTTEVNHNLVDQDGNKLIGITHTNMETGEKDVTILSSKGVFVEHYDQNDNLMSYGEMVDGKEVKSMDATYDDDGKCTKLIKYDDGKVSSITEHVYDKHSTTHIIDNDGDGKADITRTHLYNKGEPYATIETKDNITNISMDERHITIDEEKGIITVAEKGEDGERVSYEATRDGLKDGKWENLVEKITKKPDMELKDKYFNEVDNKVETLEQKSLEDVLKDNREGDIKDNMEKIKTQIQALQNGKNPNLSTDTSATVTETEQSTTHSSSSNDGLGAKGAGLRSGLKTDNDASNNASRGKAETGTNPNKTNSGQIPYYSKNNTYNR